MQGWTDLEKETVVQFLSSGTMQYWYIYIYFILDWKISEVSYFWINSIFFYCIRLKGISLYPFQSSLNVTLQFYQYLFKYISFCNTGTIEICMA